MVGWEERLLVESDVCIGLHGMHGSAANGLLRPVSGDPPRWSLPSHAWTDWKLSPQCGILVWRGAWRALSTRAAAACFTDHRDWTDKRKGRGRKEPSLENVRDNEKGRKCDRAQRGKDARARAAARYPLFGPRWRAQVQKLHMLGFTQLYMLYCTTVECKRDGAHHKKDDLKCHMMVV